MEESKKNKKKVIVLTVAGVLTFALIAGGMGVGIASLVRSEMQSAKVNTFIEYQMEKDAEAQKQENEYIEDGFKVGGNFEIKSTAQISDAYKKSDPSGLSAEDQETYQMASDVIDKVIKDGMTDYEKEVAIYDWMFDNIGQGMSTTIQMPGQNASAYTPHEVLSSKNGVCVGYATTFRLLMNMLGMDVHIVHNDYHSWDEIKLDDGEWYHVDIYTDVSSRVRYRNFNMTDDIARNGHEWDDSGLPEAKGIKYSYALQNAKEAKDLFEIPAKIKELVDSNKSDALYFSFPKKFTESDIALANTMISQCQQSMYALANGGSCDLSASFYPDGNDSYVLAVFITNYTGNQNQTEKADEKDVEKMTQTINEVFGISEGEAMPGDGGAVPENPMPKDGGTVPEKPILTENAENVIVTEEGKGVVEDGATEYVQK